MHKLISISDFSKKVNVSNRMLRHYEKVGLIQSQRDSENGYRFYNESDTNIVSVIKELQLLGFTLKEIALMFEQRVTHEEFIEELKNKESEFRIDIDQKTISLVKIQRLLASLESTNTLLNLNTLDYGREKKMKTYLELNELPQISLFYEQLEEYLNKCDGNHYFVTFDIDNFAHINSSYGFDTGDKVIYTVYDIIRQELIEPLRLSMYTRVGGDEFGLVVTDHKQEEVLDAVRKTLDTIHKFNYQSLNMKECISSSCGIYMFNSYESIHELYHHSTKSLMEAKRNGKNQFFMVMS